MNDQQSENIAGRRISDAVFFAMMIALMIAWVVGITISNKNQAEEYTRQMITPAGRTTGVIKSVSVRMGAEPKIIREGNVTLIIPSQHLRIVFMDGRTLDLLGMPEKPVPTDAEVTVVWNRFHVLIEIVGGPRRP